MAKIKIDNQEVTVPDGITLIQACDYVGVEIPRFCYHDRLSVAGNCRMCLVELENGPPKPIASCATNVADGMSIKTKSDMVKKARKGVMEFLLANHPLDCPICDQGGECDLQDQAYFYGSHASRFAEDKRAVKPKDFGPLIKTEMTRCIHCTRCVRFATEVAGVEELGTMGRGENMEITPYIEQSLTSELSGNMIDLCPVGALTSKPYAFNARPWELTKTESIDIQDAVGSNIRVDSRGMKVMRILPRLNEDINQEWISDKARFSYDGLALQRLDTPYIRKEGKLTPVGWKEAIAAVVTKLQNTKAKNIAALVGDLADVESIFLLKELLSDLGAENYDCRPENSIMSDTTRSSYIFNSEINNIEAADLFLLIGTNPRTEAAIINSRISNIVRNDPVKKVYNIGKEQDWNYPVTELGNDINILEEILNNKHDFAAKLAAATKPMIIIGEQCFCHEGSHYIMQHINDIIHKYGVISDSWNGYNILHNAAARVGALDLKFTPKTGKDTAQIINNSGKDDVVFLLGYDAENLKKLNKSFKIYIGTHGDLGAQAADIILPAAVYTEKTATYVNTEGRIQNTVAAVTPVGEAWEDWRIINKIRKKLDFDFMKSYAELKKALKIKHPIFQDKTIIHRDNKIATYDKSQAAKINKFSDFIENFYITNVITRHSKVMAQCSRDILKK